MSDEWGPWIEHDGKGCPVKAGMWIDVEYRGKRPDGGRVNRSVVRAPNWIWPKEGGLLFAFDVIRYRIRKPRGLTILENLIADLPAPVGPKVDA